MHLDLIIPTYNRSSLLRDCLDSVVRANRPADLKVQVIIADNKSTDDTKSVVQNFIDQQSGQENLLFRYLFAGRIGKSAALNDSLAQTNGEIIGLIDDDELLDPAWFEVVYRELSSDPDLAYIGGPYLPNWEKSEPEWFPNSYTGIVGIVGRPNRISFTREFNGMLMGGNAAIRRSVLEQVLPYPEHLGKLGGKIRSGEDEVIYHRLLDLNVRGVVIPEMIIYHWIPAARLTKPYFRKWVIGRGISVGSQLRERGFTEPALLGIPRYKFGAAVSGMKSMMTGSSSKERFTAQLSILDCFATLYGRHFYRA